MTKKQRKEFVELLEAHDIGFISDDLFIFVEKIIQEEVEVILNQ